MRRERQKIVRRGWLIIGAAAALSVVLTLLVVSRLGFFDNRQEDDLAGVKEQPSAVRVVGRKNIYDRNHRELAVSFRLTSIYARPLEVVDIDTAARAIAVVLAVDEAELRSLLKAERSFVWLGRQLPAALAEKILGQDIPGIYGVDEMHRFYPHRQIAAPVLGFVKDDQGLAGIEFQYDNVLRGIVGKDVDLASVGLSLPDGVAENGADLILSLDVRLQALLEKQLGRAMTKTKAATGVAVVMNSETGAVLAMGSLPSYDPNSFWNFSATERRNRAVVDPVFSGGMSRLFGSAAAYELHGDLAVTPAGVNDGKWQQEAEGVFVSSNLASLSGSEVDGSGVSGFVERLAIGNGTGIDLPAEPNKESEHRFAVDEMTASTSAMDLLTAFARTINGGVLVKPHILAGARSAEGTCSVSADSRSGSANFRVGLRERLAEVLAGSTDNRRAVIIESRVAEQLVEDRFAARAKSAAGEVELAPLEGDSVVADGAGNDARYYATMLGMATGTGPKLVMVAALSGSRFDPVDSSSLAGLGREVLRKAVALSREKSPDPEKLPAADEEAFCKAWLKLQKQPGASRVSPPREKVGVMPDVSGSSLRRALQVLQPYGLPIRVQGGGRVVEQRPVAGASLQGAQEVVLSLQLEQ